MNEPAAYSAYAPFAIGGKRKRPVLVALLRGVGEMLAAILDPFDRPTQQSRRGDDREILGIDTQFRSEAAADIGRCHPQAAFIERDTVGQSGAQIVRLLR